MSFLEPRRALVLLAALLTSACAQSPQVPPQVPPLRLPPVPAAVLVPPPQESFLSRLERILQTWYKTQMP